MVDWCISMSQMLVAFSDVNYLGNFEIINKMQ